MFSLPAITALRAAYPGAEIVLLGQPWHAQFWQHRPGPIDRVIVVPPSRGVYDVPGEEDPAELERFFDRIRMEEFDVAVQMHGGGRNSNPFVSRLGARLTVGLRAADAPPLDRYLPYIYHQNEIMRYLELVALVGAQPVTLEPEVIVTRQDMMEAEWALANLQGPIVALHPGAGDPRRRWPAEKFAQVGDACAKAGASVLITGAGEEEGALAKEIIGRMSMPARDISNRLTISGMAGLLSCCQVVVSNDSGPLHLAAAVGAATVGIYWCGNVITATVLTRARHRLAISWRLDCSVCGANVISNPCDHRASFVADVPVEEVEVETMELLRQGSKPPRLGLGSAHLPTLAELS